MIDLKGKRILFLEGENMMMPVLEKAKKYGVYSIIVNTYDTDLNPAKLAADKHYEVNFRDIPAMLKIIKEERVNGILNMFWSALITLGAALGIAKGFVNSGVGQKIINWLIGSLGEGVANPVLLVTVFLLAGYVLSLFMSNGSLVSMLAAVGVPMAVEIGINPMPIAMACVFGASLAMATPAATTSVTMVQVAGYRFKDYFRIGGLTGVIGLITAWTTIVVFYGLI